MLLRSLAAPLWLAASACLLFVVVGNRGAGFFIAYVALQGAAFGAASFARKRRHDDGSVETPE